MNTPRRTCVVTGASGWLGRCVAAEFERGGWQVRAAVRHPSPQAVASGAAVAFQLGAAVPSEVCAEAEALVHCAYDFQAMTWEEVLAVNVRGTDRLLAAAQAASIPRIVVISTMSAFDGCISIYGRSKLAIEKSALQAGAMVLRPGLIHGEGAGGMVGRLAAQVRCARVLPLFNRGAQRLYLIHEQDLTGFIRRFCEGEIPQSPEPITAAHAQAWTFRQILEAIARGLGRKLTFFPVPWRPVWAIVRFGEACGLRLNFRSDSLVSLMNQDPQPDFSRASQFGLQCRPFDDVLRKAEGA